MSNALRILNSFVLLLILGCLIMIYLKLPKVYTMGEIEALRDLPEDQRLIEIDRIPIQRIHGNITGDVEVIRPVSVRGSIDCY